MDNYGPETYGDRIAEVYVEWSGQAFDPSTAVQFLGRLAGKSLL